VTVSRKGGKEKKKNGKGKGWKYGERKKNGDMGVWRPSLYSLFFARIELPRKRKKKKEKEKKGRDPEKKKRESRQRAGQRFTFPIFTALIAESEV